LIRRNEAMVGGWPTLQLEDRKLLLATTSNVAFIHSTNCRMHSEHRVGSVLSFSPVVGIGIEIPPTPHPQARMPFPLVPEVGAHPLAREVAGVPIPTRGHTVWYSANICAS
jgi:hypothetical protein